MGWAGIKNGDLLTFAESQFDVFITVDRNLSYQQNLSNFGIAMIVLKARSNRYEDLLPFAAPIMAKLDQLENGSFILISLDDPDDL